MSFDGHHKKRIMTHQYSCCLLSQALKKICWFWGYLDYGFNFFIYFAYLCIALCKKTGIIKEKALSTDCHVWGHLFLCAHWQMWGSWREWMAPDITDMRPEEPLGPVGEVKKEGLNCFNQEVTRPHSDMPLEESVVINERYLRFHPHQMNKVMWFKHV